MLGELFKNTPVQLSFWNKILLIKSKRAHALRDKNDLKTRETGVRNSPNISICNIHFHFRKLNFFLRQIDLELRGLDKHRFVI